MNRIPAILCYVVLAGGLIWFFPLFHVVRNDIADNTREASAFNAAEVAKAFWSGQLIPSLKKAPDAATVLSALQDDPQSARARFSRKVGVSRTSLLVLRGSGTIVTMDKKGVGIAFQPSAKEPDVVLQTGLLFGNVVRDATDLLDASKFADSRQFSEMSTELNRIVEARVIAVLKEKSALGRHVDFAGCAEIQDDSKVTKPFTIIPLDVRTE
jgi:predicted lipoprotein